MPTASAAADRIHPACVNVESDRERSAPRRSLAGHEPAGPLERHGLRRRARAVGTHTVGDGAKSESADVAKGS
jgi:hypothetical protein